MVEELTTRAEIGEGDALLRALAGGLTDGFDKRVLIAPPQTHLVLELSRVGHVTSFGVREWINAAKAARAGLTSLFFVHASPRMLDQFNMVMGFDAGGTLLTFEAPYLCETCGEETSWIFDSQLDRDVFQALEAPIRQCELCGHDAELDDDPSVCFEYVRTTEIEAPPPAVVRLFRHDDCWLRVIPGVRLGMKQVVEGELTGFVVTGTIDHSFPARRIVAASDGPIALSLKGIRHFDPSGFDAFSKITSNLASKQEVRLVRVPPVILHRLEQEPELLGQAILSTLWLPSRCRKCSRTEWAACKSDAIGKWAKKVGSCKSCGGQTTFGIPPDTLKHFATFLATPTSTRRPRSVSRPRPMSGRRAISARGSGEASVERTGRSRDQYETLCKLAEGGMAEVFLVRQHGAAGFKRLAVMKTIRSEFLTDDRTIRLFLDEAKAAAGIDHPNIIRVYDLGRHEGAFYMVLEYVHGRAVSQILRHLSFRDQTMPQGVAVAIAADLCRALARAHGSGSAGTGLIHRDVTPANVLVSFDGTVKLIDFGLVGVSSMNWGEGMVMGNPPWVAPEIYRLKEPTPQTDLWGVGLLLYSMLTIKNPFSRGHNSETAAAIMSQEIKRPRKEIPRKVFAVISRTLKKDPAARYANASLMEAELRKLLLKLRGPTNVSEWLLNLFSHEIEIEQDFIGTAKSHTFVEALLNSTPNRVQSFFQALRDADSGAKGNRR